MKCPKCQSDITEHAHFCPSCGEEIDVAFCVMCGNAKKKDSKIKLDKVIAAAVVLGILLYLGYAYLRTHNVSKQQAATQVRAGIQHIAEQGEELLNQELRGVAENASAVLSAPESSSLNSENIVQPGIINDSAEDQFKVVDDTELPFADKITHDLKAMVGPDLSHEQLTAIAHSVLDDRTASAPNDIFVLSIFDGEPNGSIALIEEDPHFVAKFLYLNRLLQPGESVPEKYLEIASNLFVYWAEE
ncbi:MAG: zinc ribbon domain-containing protein [Patescibacteria group bacterium]|nr:zinc ribbon domain-containing protein [Patescibacteria group bacterium]